MSLVLYAGLILAALGIAGLVWCIVAARRVGSLPEAEGRARLRFLVAVNGAALGLGFLGVALVFVALMLQG